MKKKILYIILSASFLTAQVDLYPVEDFFGGGIGYSPMYINLKSIPGESMLPQMGLDTNNFSRPFVIHGGEGFAHVAGRWRLGGYAGIGASRISTVPNITLYIDRDASGSYTAADTSVAYSGDFSPSLEAKFSFSLGAATVEYVMPILQDLEISAGALLGLGRINMTLDHQTGTPKWEDVFSGVYGTLDSATGAFYYEVTDFDDAQSSGFSASRISGVMTDLSALFFNFQPYVAIKWQFLDRMGLRISAGYNRGIIRQGRWRLNGRTLIGDSPSTTVEGISFRTMLYFGL